MRNTAPERFTIRAENSGKQHHGLHDVEHRESERERGTVKSSNEDKTQSEHATTHITIYVSACVYIYMCICIYIYIYIYKWECLVKILAPYEKLW